MASTKLTRTNGTPTNTKIMTFSVWFKIGTQTNQQTLISSVEAASGGSYTDLKIMNAATHRNVFRFECKTTEGNYIDLKFNRSLRDPGAFYNIIIAVDTTQATDTNRVKIYVNGVQETSFATATYPPQNHNLDFSKSGIIQQVGAYENTNYWDGLMSYFAFVDGTAYDQSYFGEVESSSGIWKIKTAPSVTYGNNGFLLKMDTSSPGTDTSGNSNTFTASGTPTLTQDNASNNLVTFNPLRPNSISQTYSNGNNTVIRTGAGGQMNGTQGVTKGKWYYECLIDDYWQYLGWTAPSLNTSQTATCADSSSGFYGLYSNASAVYTYANGSNTPQGSYTTMASGQIWGIAFDADNAKMYFSVNGVWENSSDPANQTNPAMSSIPVTDFLVPAIGQGTNSRSSTIKINFGNGFFGTTAVASSNADAAGHGLFKYAVPTGFYTLNTKNLNTYG